MDPSSLTPSFVSERLRGKSFKGRVHAGRRPTYEAYYSPPDVVQLYGLGREFPSALKFSGAEITSINEEETHVEDNDLRIFLLLDPRLILGASDNYVVIPEGEGNELVVRFPTEKLGLASPSYLVQHEGPYRWVRFRFGTLPSGETLPRAMIQSDLPGIVSSVYVEFEF